MYDSTNINDIPTSAPMVGYYVDGLYAVSEATVRNRFPSAILVGISVIGSNQGVVGDVEVGCMSTTQAINWVKTRRASGVDPTIYCNQQNDWAGIRQAFQRSHLTEPHYWVADYDGSAVIPAGAIAKQYANQPMTGGHFDLSAVADSWPGVDGLHGGGIYALGTVGNLDEKWLTDAATRIVNMMATLATLSATLTALKAAIAALPTTGGGSVDLTAVNAKLDALTATLAKIESGLRSA